jgi:hypothetical protein
LRCAYDAHQTELVYYCCEAVDLTALLQDRKQMACKTLFPLMGRLCDHITGNTDVVQVETILHWIHDICLHMTDPTRDTVVGYLTNNATTLRDGIDDAVDACGTAHTSNRQLVRTTVDLLRTLIR